MLWSVYTLLVDSVCIPEILHEYLDRKHWQLISWYQTMERKCETTKRIIFKCVAFAVSFQVALKPWKNEELVKEVFRQL